MLSNKLALTYADDAHLDGAGAQLQRIYGIYALCKALDFTYVHSPVATIGYYGVIPVHEGEKRNILGKYESTFMIPSDDVRANYPHSINFPNPSLEDLMALNAQVGEGSDRVLARLTLPYNIIDRYPEYYDACRTISPFRHHKRGNGPIRVAIHLRRGDLKFIASDRIISNSYYIVAALRIGEILAAKGMDFVVELHTEVGDETHFPPE